MENAPWTCEKALEGLKNGQFISLRDAAAKTGLGRTTLTNRQNGMKTRQEGHTKEQKLSPELENELVQWILEEDSAGLAPTLTHVRSMAVNLLEYAGDPTGLGENWHARMVSVSGAPAPDPPTGPPAAPTEKTWPAKTRPS